MTLKIGWGLGKALSEQEASPAWRRTLWLILIVQSFLMAGTTIIGPVVPLLLPELGVDGDHDVRVWTGAILGATPLTAAFTSPIWGQVAQRMGCKKVIAISAVAVSLTAILMWFARSPLELLLLRVLMGSFSGFSAAGLTLVSSLAPRDRLGYALGWLSAGQIIGTLTGPVLGGVVADLTHSIRSPFWLTSALALFSGVLVLLAVPKEVSVRSERSASFANFLSVLSSSPMVASLALVMLLATTGLRAGEPMVVLQTQELLGASHANLATFAGVAVAISGFGNMLVAPFFGRRSDAIGYRRTLMIGLLGASLTAIPQAIVGDYTLFVSIRFVFGMFVGGVLPPLQALIAREAPEDVRASIFGVTAAAGFLGGFIGPITSGLVAANFGLGAAFVLSGLALLCCFIAVPFVVPPDRRVL